MFLLFGMIIPAMLGWLILRVFFPFVRTGWGDGILGFLIGQSFLTVGMFFFSLLGWPLERWTLGSMFVLSTLGLGWFWHVKRRNRAFYGERSISSHSWPPYDVWMGVIALIGFIYFAGVILATTTFASMYDVPGTCIWGLKAKVFFLERDVSSEYFVDDSMGFTQRSYPLGFPLFTTWFYLLFGGVDDYVIRWLPLIFVALANFFIFFSIKQRGGIGRSLFFILLLILASGWVRICRSFYAEGLLLLHAVVGFMLIKEYFEDPERRDYLRLGFWLLGGAAWIKNEGLIFYAVAVVVTGILGYRMGKRVNFRSALRYIGMILLPLMIFVLPWRILCSSYGVGLQDFMPMSWEMLNWERLAYPWKALLHLTKELFLDPSDSGLMGILFVAGLVMVSIKTQAGIGPRFYGWCSLGIILVLSVAFVFTAHDLQWHLKAADRLILLPLILLFLCVLEWDKEIGRSAKVSTEVGSARVA